MLNSKPRRNKSAQMMEEDIQEEKIIENSKFVNGGIIPDLTENDIKFMPVTDFLLNKTQIENLTNGPSKSRADFYQGIKIYAMSDKEVLNYWMDEKNRDAIRKGCKEYGFDMAIMSLAHKRDLIRLIKSNEVNK